MTVTILDSAGADAPAADEAEAIAEYSRSLQRKLFSLPADDPRRARLIGDIARLREASREQETPPPAEAI